MTPSTTLVFEVERIDYHYAELDSNCIAFIAGSERLFLSISTCLEGDPLLDEIQIESGGQETLMVGGIASVEVEAMRLRLILERRFRGAYDEIVIMLPGAIDFEIVDFLFNSLFLGDSIVQRHANAELLAIRQTQTRRPCDEN